MVSKHSFLQICYRFRSFQDVVLWGVRGPSPAPSPPCLALAPDMDVALGVWAMAAGARGMANVLPRRLRRRGGRGRWMRHALHALCTTH